MASTTTPNELTDVLEERLIDAEYKVWKKNTCFLYDYVCTHALEWPSLTCQWLPTVRNAGEYATEHSLLLGTHTSGDNEQNYLMVAHCILPKDADVVPVAATATNLTGSSKKTTAGGSEVNNNNNNNNKAAPTTTAPRYDEEKKEMGGFGQAQSNVGKIEIKMKIKHEGEVNRARHMPQNHFVVASRGPNPEVYIFDLTKHPSFPSDKSTFCPQGVCIGHEKEGYAMAWSKHQEGHLLTGSEDCSVKLWDINAAVAAKADPGIQIQAVRSLLQHKDIVEDVDWHHMDPNLVGSVGDDQMVVLWDTRDGQKPIAVVEQAHENDINCIAFNPGNEFVFATGSADKTIAIWDKRNLKQKVHSLVGGHSDQIYMVEWAPFDESVLASCSADRRVAVWDLTRIGAEQSPEDAEDGPPELLFLHGGHTSKVSDISWNAKYPWTIASVSEDNVLQVWNMAEEIYAEDDVEEKEASQLRDGLLGDDELE